MDDSDQSYAIVEHKSVIVVDDSGRCVIAEEEGERDAKTHRPKRWKCTSECKLPTAMEAQCIMATKALFEKPIQTLREGLNGIDVCGEHGHYKHPLNADHEMPYHELAGHPLPCTVVNNKSVASKLGCMTLVNIWQETVLYDKLTINERQKKDQAFSSMLDEVRCGCPTPECIQALQERVIETPVVDKFEELLVSKQSPLCLFPTRKSCQEFNSIMLSRLKAEVKEIPWVDEVDEASSTFKWSEKATEEMKKLNRESQNKLPAVHSDPPNPKTVSVDMKNVSVGKLRTENTSDVGEGLILDRYRYNPVSVEWQRRVCRELGLRFVCANKCVAGDPDVRLKPPTLVKRI